MTASLRRLSSMAGSNLFELAAQERQRLGRPLEVGELQGLVEARGDEAVCAVIAAALEGSKARWSGLKRIAQLLALTEDHALYQNVLQGQDAGLDFPKWHAAGFVGSGLGAGSFNVYRRLEADSGVLFEKIYSRKSRDLQRSAWFYRHTLPELPAPPFTTPRRCMLHKGRRLALQYQDYHELPEQLPKAEIPARAVELSLFFLDLPPPRGLHRAPAAVRDFTLESNYVSGRAYLRAFLDAQGRAEAEAALAEIEATLARLPQVLAHGDINSPNAYRGGLLLDWDRSGYYPPGFDLGFSLSRTLKLAEAGALEDFVAARVLPYLDPARHADFLKACLFFALVFYARRFETKVSDAFLLDLWELCLVRFGMASAPRRRPWWRLRR